MEKTLKIGIRNIDDNKKEIVKNIFNSIKFRLENTRHYFNIYIEDYEFLKKEFEGNENKKEVSKFEKSGIKGLCEPNKKIILFNDSFFESRDEIKQSVFLHEIGHIVYRLPKDIQGFDMSEVYKEYLADKFLFEIDENIFKKGRVEEDIRVTNINTIKEDIKKNKDNYADSSNDNIIIKFITFGGKFSYYYSFYQEDLLINKVNDLIKFIEEQIPEKDWSILYEIRDLCINLRNKSESTLIEDFGKIEEKITAHK